MACIPNIQDSEFLVKVSLRDTTQCVDHCHAYQLWNGFSIDTTTENTK